MKTFIVDNGSKYLDNLAKLITGDEIEVLGYDEIDNRVINDEDLIILSGGHKNPVLWHPKEFAKEIDLVKAHNGPIIGICLGFQLIVHVFGSHFHLLDERRKGLYEIDITNSGLSTFPESKYTVFENHMWSARSVSHPLISLANSEDGVEIVRHESRQIYAMQFHPEGDGTHDGKIILYDIIESLNSI